MTTEKKDIVKIFLEKGYLLQEGALDLLCGSGEKIEQILGRLKDVKDAVISPEILLPLLRKPRMIEILKEFEPRKNIQLSIEDFHSFLIERYALLKELLERRTELTNLISINKITGQMREFSIIASLLERDKNCAIAEDPTGAVKIYFDGSFDVGLDEVVGIRCEAVEERIFAREIVYPDVPLKRAIARADESIHCLFISNFDMDEESFDRKFYEKFLDWIDGQSFESLYIFFLGKVSSKEAEVKDFLGKLPRNSFKIFVRDRADPKFDLGDAVINSPAILKLANITLLIVSSLSGSNRQAGTDTLLHMLKSRYIHLGAVDGFFIDPVPDIAIAGGLDTEGQLNYKGTTIISTGRFVSKAIFWIVDLKTRETIKIDLSKI